MWTASGITPDEDHQKPATLAAKVEAPTIEAPATEAPVISGQVIGGNCYAVNRDEHNLDLMHAGAASNPDGAAMTLGLKSYAMNVDMAQEVQCEVGRSEPMVEAIDADVGDKFQERVRITQAAGELSAGVGEGVAVAAAAEAPAQTTAAGEAGASMRRSEKEKHEHEPHAEGEKEVHLVEKRGGGDNMMQSLDKLLAKMGIGQQRFECKECGGKEVNAPAEEVANAAHVSAKQQASRNFDPSFFARKQNA